jgi:Holliday junction resolvase-like predicted endonuclease
MTATHAQRKALGDFGERTAARFLVDLGYALVDRNWRCPDGELDIVAIDGADLVVCEVKTRTSSRFGRVRVDVVAVMAGARGAAEVDHRIAVV